MFERFKSAALFGAKTSSQNPFERAISAALLPHTSNGVTVNINELSFYQLHGKRWQPPAKSLWSQLNGQHTSSHKGQGMTFSEVRQYQAGDDVRQIDWRVTARTGKVHTKLFTEERERPVVLFIDLTPSMFTGTQLLLKSVQMCHLASLLAWTAMSGKDRVGAIIRCGDSLTEIRPSSSKVALLRLLNRLCEIHNSGLNNVASIKSINRQASLQKVTNLCRKGSELIILSDFSSFSEQDMASIAQVSAHNKVRAIQIYDPIELGDTQAKGIQKVLGKEQIMSVNLSNNKVKHSIHDTFRHQQQQLTEQLSQYGIALSIVSSGIPILQQLQPHTF
ncbi:cytosolic protein [Vibrio sp. UCD-FRSSP16_10]|uniref:DUF58 domain-containing protein n=1 Tax=unclassified Vibrio TaxID=2614977 RepID=UPI0008000C21|nr:MULTISPECIES: DUF58 domain-containing protein [unclassified Vibrio]OBT16938.1 cytosolic protein [Vibrio sp. UCD-FRSSP16_30]OBT21929.1 cytosolic protein [Vibrio sp. UCD-FRSSP16_10]